MTLERVRRAVSGLLLLFCSFSVLAQGQSGRPDFPAATVEQVVIEHGLDSGLPGAIERDQVFFPPHFRYSIQVSASGRIRPLIEPRKTALERWATVNQASEFVRHFTHEVEITEGGRTFWLPWQVSLIAPYEEEMKGGGAIEVRVLLLGAAGREVLFVAIAFQAGKQKTVNSLPSATAMAARYFFVFTSLTLDG